MKDTRHKLPDILRAITNDISPINTALPLRITQDRFTNQHFRLTFAQTDTLLNQPDRSLIGIRDLALISILACTGIRAAEAASLECDDLRQHYGDQVALRIRHGKGDKQRAVPYGPLIWALELAEDWLQASRIASGPVFRRVYRSHRRIGESAITPKAINSILAKYPILIDGVLQIVQPHDLRRSYARNCYMSQMEIERIRQNLGHSAIRTTLGYIGALDAEDRLPPAMYQKPRQGQFRW